MEFKIQGVQAKSGEKATGWIKIGENAQGDVKSPVVVLNGTGDGPTFCITAGIHGCEYCGIEAAIRLSKDINPKRLNGKVIIVPVQNMNGFIQRSPYVNPQDNTNANRAWPGNAASTPTERMTNALFSNVISKAEYLADLHGGDVREGHGHNVFYAPTGKKEIDDKIMNLVRYHVAKYVKKLEIYPGSLSMEASKLGIPAITSEAGQLGLIQEDAVAFHYEGMLNIMRFLKMVPGEPRRITKKSVSTYLKLRTSHAGLCYHKVKPGDEVKKGQVVAEVKNVFGEKLEEITAPFDGWIMITFPEPVVYAGDQTVGITELEGPFQ